MPVLPYLCLCTRPSLPLYLLRVKMYSPVVLQCSKRDSPAWGVTLKSLVSWWPRFGLKSQTCLSHPAPPYPYLVYVCGRLISPLQIPKKSRNQRITREQSEPRVHEGPHLSVASHYHNHHKIDGLYVEQIVGTGKSCPEYNRIAK